MANSFEKIDINLSEELDRLEKYLINKGALDSNSGQSYYAFYEQVVKINNIPSKIEINKFKNLTKLTPNEYYENICLLNLAIVYGNQIENSKYYKLNTKIQEITSSNQEVLPSSIASVIVSILTPSDFDKPYYRAIALLTIVNTSDIETEFEREIEPKHQVDYSTVPTVSVFLNSNNKIIYNKKNISENEFKTKLYKFIKQNKNNHLIRFSAEKNTAYDFYLKVHHDISETYTKIRNEKSKEQYGKLFSALAQSAKEKIIETYPKNIEEFTL